MSPKVDMANMAKAPEAQESLESSGLYFPGSRIGILLIHGLGGTPRELKFVAKGLNAYGYTVFCPRLVGHCGTEADLIATSWTDWTASVQEAFNRLAVETDVIFVGGLSAGAVMGLYLAQTQPGVRGLGLYSTTLRWDGWSIPKSRFLLPLFLRLPYFGPRFRFEEVFPYGIKNERLRHIAVSGMHSGNSSEAGLSATPGLSLRELWQLVDIVKKQLPSLKVPTLLIHARHDDIAHWHNSEYVREHLGGPSELILLDDSYHIITIDQERDIVCDTTARYFSDLLSDDERTELARTARKPIPDRPPTGETSP